jgi:hypothetical protein
LHSLNNSIDLMASSPLPSGQNLKSSNLHVYLSSQQLVDVGVIKFHMRAEAFPRKYGTSSFIWHLIECYLMDVSSLVMIFSFCMWKVLIHEISTQR